MWSGAVDSAAVLLLSSTFLLLLHVSTPVDLLLLLLSRSILMPLAESNLVSMLVRGVVSDHDPRHQLLRGYHTVLQVCQPARGIPLPRVHHFRFLMQPAGAHLV